MILWKERILAALVPITTVIVGSLSSFLGFFAPLACYFILKSFRQTFTATNAMRYFDICITAMAYAAGLGGEGSISIKSSNMDGESAASS